MTAVVDSMSLRLLSLFPPPLFNYVVYKKNKKNAHGFNTRKRKEVELEEPHEYWLTLPNGEKKQLFGITGAIQRQVAKSEYDGCPEYLIKRAGEYGT